MTKPTKPFDAPGPAAATALQLPTHPMMKNTAAAPVIYFDAAPCWGTINGIIELELAVQILNTKSETQVQADVVCVAHLRCSRAAAAHLRSALDAALALANTAPGDVAPGALADNAPAAAPNGGEPKH